MEGGDGAQKQQEELHHPHSTHRLDLHLPLSPVVLSTTPPADPGGPQEAADAATAASAGNGPAGGHSPRAAAAQPARGEEATGDNGGSLLRGAQRSASLISRQSSQFLHPVRRSGIQVYGFGRGDCGQLGNGGTEDARTPVPVDALQGKDVVGLSGGYFHSAAVSGDGEVWVWGTNDTSQLGLRNTEQALVPTRLDALENFQVTSCACGSSHTVAAVDDGAVAAWGASDFGQCGLGSTATQAAPRLMKGLKEAGIARVAAGGNHTLLLASSGDVYSCGDGTFGATGQGSSESSAVPLPILPLWPLGVVQVSCGESHSAALTVDGQLFAWGRGKYGQLGVGDFDNRTTPAKVRALTGIVGQQVSCGGDHTALLTREGQVYTWGRGTWGQTGLGHNDNVCYPKRIEALEAQRLVQVACGGRHTLLLSSSNELWGCGCNENGQLSAGAAGNVHAPRKVTGLPGAPILYVAAGGDHSLVVVQHAAPAELVSIGPSHTRPHGEGTLPLPLPSLRQLIEGAAAAAAASKAGRGSEAERSARLGELSQAVEIVFSCPAFLAYTMSGKEPWLVGAAQPQRMETDDTADSTATASDGSEAGGEADDGRVIGATFQGLLRLYDDQVLRTLGLACIKLLDTLEKYLLAMAERAQRARGMQQGQQAAQQGQHVESGWVARVLFILLQNPLNGEGAGVGGQLVMRLSRILAGTLQGEQRLAVRQALQALLQRLPPEVFAARCVRPVQRYLGGLVDAGKLGAARMQILMAGVLLDVLRQSNEQAGGIIPYTEFYNQALSEHANLREEYVLWLQHQESNPQALVSLCQMPYLLSPEAKSHILQGEAMAQQQTSMASATMQAFFQGAASPALAGFLAIHVRRTHVVEDALTQIMYRQQDIKKPLRVTFVSGGVPEPAQDEGGVTKEFFQLLTREIFREEYGMFKYSELMRTWWFNPASLESEVEYALVGAVLGLAIYNGVLLDVHFPLVVYKKLLGLEPDFKDLKEAFPDLGRGLQALLDFTGDVEATFCRSFTAEFEFYGEMREHELVPGGSHIPVTSENRQDYVRAYTKWLLGDSIAAQFKAFARGFIRVCGGPALSLFRPEELELLVCGLPHLDFEALEGVAKYEGGYSRDHPAIRWFWEILHAMPLEQKRQFLAFTTGSDRAPVGGLAKLPIIIQRAGPDTDRLPTAHTCFNAMLLPEYRSKQRMAERLLTAIQNATGFGLQ